MKKLWLFILGLFTLFFAGNSALANEYEYKNLNISANILSDWSVEVTEKFTADFFVNKHWIIRSIPLNYSVDWSVFHIDISDINVEWKTFVTERTDEEVAIKIWDSDITVNGEQIYPISYTTYGLIKNFSWMGYSELYWNLVGYDFDTNINKVRAVIYLPKDYTGFSSDDFLITTDWKTTSVQEFQWRFDRSHWDRIIITYDKGLSAYNGITLAIKFPNGYFEFDNERQKSLIWRSKMDYSDQENVAPDTASNAIDEAVENHSERPNPQPEAIIENIVESESTELEPIPDADLIELDQKPETEQKFYGVTSNNYVSSWPKTKPQWNYEYEYTNLDIRADILADGTMNVNEDFTADFHVYKHWIIRVIPLNYSVSNYPFHIDVSNINVQWKKFSTSRINWEIEIKIWDPDRTVNGIQNYPISYTTYGLIRNYAWEGYAELYWNLVWFDFDTSIDNVKAEIYLPKPYPELNPDDFLITVDWKTTSINDFQWLVDWKWWNKITITYDRGLSSYHGITLSVKFPPDYFEFDHSRQAKLTGNAKQSLSQIFEWFLSFLIPIWIVVLIIILRVKNIGKSLGLFKGEEGLIDRKSGKLKWDFAKQFPVIVQYEPPKWVNSAEAGLLLHRGAKPKDILSLIYKRASEWLIKLSFEEDEWSFFKKATKNVIITKIRDINPESPAYERDFFKAIVRGEKSRLSGDTNLYNKLGLSTLESYWRKSWWFTGGKSKWWLLSVGLIAMYFLVSFLGDALPWIVPLAFIGFIVLAVYSAAASKLKETEEWARLISHVLWYREFLAACDENKLRLFLQQDPLYFDKILPYAVAFGLDTELIKKIEPLLKEMNIRSSWYDWDVHNIYYINNTISSSAINSVPPKASYSSSSWFSGWSSFGWGFSLWWWGGWWGWRSW